MRIVGGDLRGRRLEAPKNQRIRPTSDRTRESVFNLLAHHAPDAVEGAAVLDLFAGTGALAFEALSRGAASACLVDKESASLSLARRNAAALGVEKQVTFLRADATRLGQARESFSLVFCDAPYERNLTQPALERASGNGWMGAGSVVVAEIAAQESLPLPDRYALLAERTYGAARVIIARVVPASGC